MEKFELASIKKIKFQNLKYAPSLHFVYIKIKCHNIHILIEKTLI